MDANVPLVVPEVNPRDVANHEGILAIPNCATTPIVMALWPLHKVNPVKRVIAATYQSVSGTGRAAVEELAEHFPGMAKDFKAVHPLTGEIVRLQNDTDSRAVDRLTKADPPLMSEETN